MPVSKLAAHLGVSRVTLSRLLNGNSGVSAEMALKLSEALGTSPELWLNMQTQFDLWQVCRRKRKRTAPLVAA
jgi:addiction module HigA family antidote